MLAAVAPAVAQLKPPPQTPTSVTDPSMVIEDRGSTLEVFSTQRATPLADASGRRILQQVKKTSATATIDANHLGVVFNHAMQQQGYTTGEIAFQSKAGPVAADLAALPGFKQLTPGGLYVVRARTPSEFVALAKRLQARGDVAWVEPVVIYSPTSDTRSAK